MLNKNVFPSLQRRGGRAIKKMMPKATKVGADGVVSPRNISSQMTTPSAPLRWLRSIFLMAQPPLLFQEGNPSSDELQRTCGPGALKMLFGIFT